MQNLVQVEQQNGVTLENYFDFLSKDDIRLKGSRIGIETILGHYLAGVSPELIADW